MTIDTVVKIVQSEKHEIMQASTMNVGVNGVCNGYVKNNHVFVDNRILALLHDDHAGYHENGVVKVGEFSVEGGGSVKVNGDLDSGVLENGVEVCGEGLKVGNAGNVGEDSEEENGEITLGIEVAEVENGGSIRVLEVEEANDSEPVVDDVQEANDPEPVVDEVQDAEQLCDGNLKASFSLDAEDKRSLFDDAVSVDKSYGCQHQNLQPDDGEDDKQDLIEIEAKIDEIVVVDPVAGSGDFERTFGSNFSFGSFECAAPFSHGDINLQSEANSSEHKLNPDPCANDGHSDGSNHVYWLVKIPRADVRIYDEQIRQSEIELAENTKTRNAFQAKANQQQAYCRELKNILEAAKVEAKAARELAKNKKREVDIAHTIINQAKNGVTVEDLDSKILSLERALEHETHNLRAERELVREIRQLSHQRKQLFANPQQQQQIQQARNQRDHAEEQLKVLKKELDALRVNFVKADEHVRAAEKKHDDESAVLVDLKCQVRSINDIRQETYVHVQTLKGQRYQKNAAFYQGKNDLKIAYNYAAEGKMDSLERHCANQVETFMEMWNKNDEFRKEYIQCNMRHKLRKQGLLDGTRQINEVPPSLEKFPDDRVNTSVKADSPTAALTMDRDISIEGKVTKDESSVKVEQTMIAPVAKQNEVISSRTETEEDKKEAKVTNEEEELIKKENQLKREKEAAQLKVQRRLEEKAKAEEALERKRRTALKAQARAEFKARKEAEQKEKEREKREKKKEKKKEKKRGLNPETPPENEPAKPAEPSSESLNEPEAVEKPVIAAKRSMKATLHTKQQIKLTKPIPVALRNKGKRGLLRYWPYACFALIATFLFFSGQL